jgi:TM2 domain-containing membrane protein YozV
MSENNQNLDLPKNSKIPFLSLSLSFLFPGLGQFYNNTQTERFLGFCYVSLMLLIAIIYSLLFDPTKNNGIYDTIFQSLSFALSFASSFDGYQTAKTINLYFEQKENNT